MATTLKNSPRGTRKSRIQAKIYEHTESIEPVATKEFVRQELAPVKESVNRLWQVMLAGFGLILLVVLGGFQWLRSDMKDLKADMNKRMDRIEAKLDRLIPNK